jgi:CcmD family protein
MVYLFAAVLVVWFASFAYILWLVKQQHSLKEELAKRFSERRQK